MPLRRVTAADAAVVLSAEQQSVLECVSAGLGAAATCRSTGLDAEHVAAVVQDLVAMNVLEDVAEPTRGEPSGATALSVQDDDTPGLPDGVEPWSGADMPEGTASSHDLHAPRGVDPGSVSSYPPRRSERPAPDEVNYRRVYEQRFRDLELGEREDLAHRARGPELFALCLDASPRVIAALLDNAHFGLDHARLVALHHKTPQGLEILGRRAQLVRDGHVQRRLLSNLQTPETVLERILRLKRLLDIYRMSIDRDLPERNRLRVRSRLRPAFTTADPEERATLIIKTEGRCLGSLTGCTFDGRTTQLLCHHSFSSAIFIQNLARVPATPPALIAKLLRSPVVQRQPQLRALLMRHGNLSGDLKRRG